MADPFNLHGDAEALVIHVCKNLTPELASANITKVSSDLKGYTAGMRWVMVSQEGSSKALWNVINKPRMDVEVRAERRTIAKDIAEILEASIFRSVGISGYGTTITRVVEETGITRIPDKEESGTSRYLFSVRLTCMLHPDSMTNTFL